MIVRDILIKDYKKINKILGTDFKDNFIDNILKDLGFCIEENLKFHHGEVILRLSMTLLKKLQEFMATII